MNFQRIGVPGSLSETVAIEMYFYTTPIPGPCSYAWLVAYRLSLACNYKLLAYINKKTNKIY